MIAIDWLLLAFRFGLRRFNDMRSKKGRTKIDDVQYYIVQYLRYARVDRIRGVLSVESNLLFCGVFYYAWEWHILHVRHVRDWVMRMITMSNHDSRWTMHDGLGALS